MTAPDAPLYMPPFDEFVAWLRATPDRVFSAKPEDDKCLGCWCPVGVFARQYNVGEYVGVSHDILLRVCGDSSQEFINIDRKYRPAITAFDNYTGFMARSVTAKELLDGLDKHKLI